MTSHWRRRLVGVAGLLLLLVAGVVVGCVATLPPYVPPGGSP